MQSMKKTRISFFTNITKSQIIDNDGYFDIRGAPVTKDDCVMNELLYSKEHNEKGMPTLIDRVVTLSHPVNSNGEGADAYEGESLMEFFSGGVVKNVYLDGDVRKVDIRIKKSILDAQDKANNTDFHGRLERKDDIGVSTGLYILVDETPGTNAYGDDYRGIATSQKYNHLAMLDKSEPPAGGDDTFMRFNSSDEDVETMVINLADYIDNKEDEIKTKNSRGLDFSEAHNP
jgi:hypothetical protein